MLSTSKEEKNISISDENNTSCLPTPYESAASSDDDNRWGCWNLFERKVFRHVEHGIYSLVLSDSRVEVKRRSEEGSPSDQKKVYYPDASKWGVDDVARFFINLGYKDQAEALQEQVWFKHVFRYEKFHEWNSVWKYDVCVISNANVNLFYWSMGKDIEKQYEWHLVHWKGHVLYF